VTGGNDGVVALTATNDVVLTNLATHGVARTAIRTFRPGMKVLDSHITGSVTGIDAAATTIANTTIDDVDEGIRSRSLDLVEVDDATVSALSVGINVAPGSPVQLAGSHIDALEAIHGTLSQDGINQLSLPPLNLFGAIGVPLDPARPAPGTNTRLPAARHRQPRTADAPTWPARTAARRSPSPAFRS
jgi:hypothetical protein